VLASLGAAAQTATRAVTDPFLHRRFRNGIGTIVRLQGIDERCDSLWEHSRSADRAMVIRNCRYLKWRYMDRPDAEYSLFGVERGSELLGILVARSTIRDGMRWGYLVDFLVANKNAEGVFGLLIQAAAGRVSKTRSGCCELLRIGSELSAHLEPTWFLSRTATRPYSL
jgi:hypothetical protein